jgi:hypothetical protein
MPDDLDIADIDGGKRKARRTIRHRAKTMNKSRHGKTRRNK